VHNQSRKHNKKYKASFLSENDVYNEGWEMYFNSVVTFSIFVSFFFKSEAILNVNSTDC